MTRIVPVVDLFAGPGGLAEGFSAYRQPDGSRRYRIALSVEKDLVAHRTLRLRAFLRKFPSGFPQQYYDFLNGVLADEPDWATLYPRRWAAACDETRCLELGTSEAGAFLRGWIAKIRRKHGGRTVLLGGPPCQAYSVIGRSRNAGNAEYKADEDDRQSLYEQYSATSASGRRSRLAGTASANSSSRGLSRSSTTCSRASTVAMRFEAPDVNSGN